MGSEHTFDIVSNVNLQELRNALSQAQKEIATRFDFRGSSAGLSFDESSATIHLTADDQAQSNSVRDVLETKATGCFLVAREHYNHPRVFQRACVSERLQCVEHYNVAALHIRSAVAVSARSFASPALTLQDCVDVAEHKDSLASPISPRSFSNEVSGTIHFRRHVNPADR